MAGKSSKRSSVLNELQSVLSECFQVERQMNDIPGEIEQKKENLSKRKAKYLELVEKMKKVKGYIADNKTKLQAVIDKRVQTEEKLERVSSQRECDNEQEIVRKCNEEEVRIRENVLKLEKRREALADSLKESEETLSDIEGKIDSEIAELEKRKEELAKEFAAVSKKKNTLVQKVDNPKLIFKLERIIRSKGEIAVVKLKGGVCQGCHMLLPDQFTNIVRKNKDVQFCPYCSRILEYEEGDAEDQEIIESNTQYYSSIEDGDEQGAAAALEVSEDEDMTPMEDIGGESGDDDENYSAAPAEEAIASEDEFDLDLDQD